MSYRYKSDLSIRDVTPESFFINRRKLTLGFSAMAAGGLVGFNTANSEEAATETPNTLEEISGYNNYYEFGTGKGDPAKYAGTLTTEPWSVKIDGMVEKPGEYSLSDLLEKMVLEDRIYRFRCVEAWSMVIPWRGFELADLLEFAGVKKEAKYVAFETLLRPEEMWGQNKNYLDWPYREGLRLDEALHPLSIMATGLYGKSLPNQNGAPIRLVVPWKYGFKSIKAIVRITLMEEQPRTSWSIANPREYGFYSNVNPAVDHPRWSQASERRIGSGFVAKRQPTLLFNGYGEEVASLYEDMDLQAFY